MMFGGMMMTRGVMRGFRCSSLPFAAVESQGLMGLSQRRASTLVDEGVCLVGEKKKERGKKEESRKIKEELEIRN